MFYCGDGVEENESGGACCIHGTEDICAQEFACKQLGGKNRGEMKYYNIKYYLKK